MVPIYPGWAPAARPGVSRFLMESTDVGGRRGDPTGRVPTPPTSLRRPVCIVYSRVAAPRSGADTRRKHGLMVPASGHTAVGGSPHGSVGRHVAGVRSCCRRPPGGWVPGGRGNSTAGHPCLCPRAHVSMGLSAPLQPILTPHVLGPPTRGRRRAWPDGRRAVRSANCACPRG